jgi:hypothetical protein
MDITDSTEITDIRHIPLDVMHHHLFPLLDHPSRIEVNRVLPPHERKPTRLKKEVIAEFSAMYSRAMIQGLMNTMAKSRQNEFLRACRQFNPDHFSCLRHFNAFQRKFLRHLTDVSGRLNERLPTPPSLLSAPQPWGFVSKYMKKEIRKHIDNFFIAAAAAFNSTAPKIKFRDQFSIGLPHHIVVKLPVVPPVDYSAVMQDILEDQMEAQLIRGRELMAFWAARGDFD